LDNAAYVQDAAYKAAEIKLILIYYGKELAAAQNV
jgi:hypothetical protein